MLEGVFQPMHLLVIFFVALLVFGPKKLPELGRGIGQGIRALKEGIKATHPDPERPQVRHRETVKRKANALSGRRET